MSDTPRMDAVLGKGADWVFAEGCRLERELASMTSARDKAMSLLNEAIEENTALRSARPASEDENDDVTGERRYSHATAIAYAQHLEKKLAAKVECSECRGEGSVRLQHQHPTESYYCYTETVECGSCKGTGLRGPDSTSESGATENTTGGKER